MTLEQKTKAERLAAELDQLESDLLSDGDEHNANIVAHLAPVLWDLVNRPT